MYISMESETYMFIAIAQQQRIWYFLFFYVVSL